MKKTTKKVTKTPGSRAIYGTPYIDYMIGCKFSIPAGKDIEPNVIEARTSTKTHEIMLWPVRPDGKRSNKHYSTVAGINGHFQRQGNLKNGKHKTKSSISLNKVICIYSPTFPEWVGKSYREIVELNTSKNPVSEVKKTEPEDKLEKFKECIPEKATTKAYMSSNFVQMRLFEQPEELPDFSVKKPSKQEKIPLIEKCFNYLVTNGFDGSWENGKQKNIAVSHVVMNVLNKTWSMLTDEEKLLPRKIVSQMKEDKRFNVKETRNNHDLTKTCHYISFVRI